MLTLSDQQFIVQLAGYVMGMAGAGVIALYLLYKIFKGTGKLLDSAIRFLASLMVPKKKVVE